MASDETNLDPNRSWVIRDKKAQLESLGYRTGHLSASQIEELMELLERKKPDRDWRLKL